MDPPVSVNQAVCNPISTNVDHLLHRCQAGFNMETNWFRVCAELARKGDAMLRGVFPVLSTPFRESGECDEAGLRRLIRYAAMAGANGVVYPAIASEFSTLTGDERRRLVQIVLDLGRAEGLEVIVGISAESPCLSAEHATQAAHGKAAALMLMAPRSAGHDVSAIADFFLASTEGAGDLPVVMQNAPPPLGSSLPVDTLLAVLEAVQAVRYVKEENVPCGQRISALINSAMPNVLGVMGGAGGRFVLDEYARGACGSMPACEIVEAHVAIWNAVQAGDVAAGRAMFNRVLPLLNMGGVFRQSVVKHVLKRRGLIESAFFRDTNPPLDRYDVLELEAIIDDLEDLMTATAEPSAMAAAQ
jgi:4-hydroxy-tetrahydrodipicolinate synthase